MAYTVDTLLDTLEENMMKTEDSLSYKKQTIKDIKKRNNK